MARRRASDKLLHDKAFDTASNPQYDVDQRGLPSMTYTFLDKNLKEVE